MWHLEADARTPVDYVEAMERLLDAGLSTEAAEKVAHHPTGGPVVLGPGVIVSLFAVRSQRLKSVCEIPDCGCTGTAHP
jgi:hypothetical protein